MAVAFSLPIADHAAADDNENAHNYAHIKHFNDADCHIHNFDAQNFVYYRKIHDSFDDYDVHENTQYCYDDFLDNNETHVNVHYFDDGYFNDDDVHENTQYCYDDFLDNNETHVNVHYFDDGYFNDDDVHKDHHYFNDGADDSAHNVYITYFNHDTDDNAHNDHHNFNHDTDDNAHNDHHNFKNDTDDNAHNVHHYLYNDNDNNAHNDVLDYKYDYFDDNDLSNLEDNIDMDGTGRSGPLREEPLGRVCI
jgi:hypothetical protein